MYMYVFLKKGIKEKKLIDQFNHLYLATKIMENFRKSTVFINYKFDKKLQTTHFDCFDF